ncbi:MAG: hypothetical protein QOE15_1300 [Acidimicrobiaceae bacterium]|nr:hypothetical protein [Acidimicrobiaceae bacterium]
MVLLKIGQGVADLKAHPVTMIITDRRLALHQSYEQAAAIVAEVRPDQLGQPTPCASYDVAALLDHLVGAGHRAVELGRGETPTGYEFPHVELADAADQLRGAGKESAVVWADDARLTAETTMPWGETYTGSTLVDMYLAELATHAWDLAKATGQLDRLDEGLAVAALDGARAMLKAEYRNMMEPGSPFGSEIEAPVYATCSERLAAFMGRDPR